MNENYCYHHQWFAEELVEGPEGKKICLDCARELELVVCEFPGCGLAVEESNLLINDDFILCENHSVEEIVDAGYPYCSCNNHFVDNGERLYKDAFKETYCIDCVDGMGYLICTVPDCEAPVADETDMLVVDYDNDVIICNLHY